MSLLKNVMLKVNKIKLSGFRGIFNPQELDLVIKGNKEPRSLALFGLNSSGKTSFVDGLEWFLSEENKIAWLRRDEAEEKAYPHQAAKDKGVESFVEIDFFDSESKIGNLQKSYDHGKITKPTLSNEKSFASIYSAFVIRPYFRYLEVVEFVCSKGKDKYEKLAQWMGFESEFEFQEKIARGAHQRLKAYEDELSGKVSTFEQQLKQLTGGITAGDDEVLNFCNAILKQHKVNECKNVKQVWEKIPEISKKKIASSVGVTIDKLTRAETAISVAVLKEDLHEKIDGFSKQIGEFRKNAALIAQIDVIGLYTKALEILAGQTNADTKCPVCGNEWSREELIKHIKDELELLKKTKEEKEQLEQDAQVLKTTINGEVATIRSLTDRYKEAQEIVAEVKYDEAAAYLKILTEIADSLNKIVSDISIQIKLNADEIEKIKKERGVILEQIKNHKTKIQPSPEDTKLSEDIEKLTQTKTSWESLEEARVKQKFAEEQINTFYALKDDVIKTIQDNIKSRFDEISDRIGKYFGILRNDKEIKDIKIVLNEERGRAAGRSAEIELNYYDISVRPAYKVLSESLLNSLGLAVYFTCVKQFNTTCKFIVLDDIMNSLDIDKRDTLLDLIEQEFSDYQIILFTHDEHWFQKIKRRFPNWITKKIKNWDYITGPKIDAVVTTQEELEECLKDSTKTKTAGQLLSGHVEDRLNELCEDLWAAVRYRYSKNEPPTMEELFDALARRLKERIGTHPLVEKIAEAKKFAPILRNFVSHSRTTSISPEEVKRTATEWFALEAEFWCDKCNHFVEYRKEKDAIECQCGAKKLEKPKAK